MKLSEVLANIEITDGETESSDDIDNITCVSNDCKKGSLFFALKGTKRDGNEFVGDAISRGCSVIVTDSNTTNTQIKLEKKIISVRNGRKAMAVASSNLNCHPADQLLVCGITGTSGKTTVSYLLDSIIRGENPQTIIGTIKHIIHGRDIESNNTTPESFTIQSLLRKAVDMGAKHAVMEVSSHSLALKRVYAINFDAAVFTNLSRDHLDFHITEEEYMNSKLLLFSEQLKSNGVAAINIDDSRCTEFIKASKAGVITYGINNKSALIKAASITNTNDGTRLHISTPIGCMDINSCLRGRFNTYNILAAIAVAVGLGMTEKSIIAGIERIESVDGRFQNINRGQPFSVIIDYAHKPDALENILKTAREITKNRVISVFGCGGDRDRGKRPIMGKISSTLADITILTSDNPRTENESAIIEEILSGITDSNPTVIEDRREAIRFAVQTAREGDCVIIAGKGHETYQIIGSQKHHFDDREVALEALREMKWQ